MGPLEREMAQRRGQRKLDAMRRRVGQLRRGVVATAVVGFAVLWAVVFVQMATGHDPALGAGSSNARSTAKESLAADQERSPPRAASPPHAAEAEDDGGDSSAGEGEWAAAERAEAERLEAEQLEAEQVEIENREAELAELEEIEAVNSGQS
jgi:cytoskeletal protein RodZ